MLDTFMKQALRDCAHAEIRGISPDFDQEKFKKNAVLFVKSKDDWEGHGCWRVDLSTDEPIAYSLGPVKIYCDRYYAIVNFNESYVLYRIREDRKVLTILEDGKNVYTSFEGNNNTFIASQVCEHSIALDKHAFSKFIAREGIQIEPSKPTIKSTNPKRKKNKRPHRNQVAYTK